MGYQNSRFFLADLSRRDEQRSEEEGGGTGMRSLTLWVDFRFWRERWRPWLLLQVKGSGVLETVGLGVGGLQWKVSVGKARPTRSIHTPIPPSLQGTIIIDSKNSPFHFRAVEGRRWEEKLDGEDGRAGVIETERRSDWAYDVLGIMETRQSR